MTAQAGITRVMSHIESVTDMQRPAASRLPGLPLARVPNESSYTGPALRQSEMRPMLSGSVQCGDVSLWV